VSEPNECPRLIEVQRLWEGEIDGPTAGEVRRHLAHCSDCRAEYESWEHLSGLLARGDPAAPLLPERRRRLKEQLLAACAASLEAAGAPERRHGYPHSGWMLRFSAWHGWRPVRMILALAPLAAAMLWLLVLGHHIPPGARRPTRLDSPIGTAPHLPQRETRPHSMPIVNLPPPLVQPVPPDVHSSGTPRASLRARKQPRRVVRPRRPPAYPPALRRRVRVRMVRMVAVRPGPRREGASREKFVSRPAPARMAAAPKPIERLVIQVDAPPVEARTITHVTIRATGDPRAPGAQLAVVRTRREEALP
jgi:hypothetical protein